MPIRVPLHAVEVSRDLEADVARARKTPHSDGSDHKTPPEDPDDDEAPETPTDEPAPVPIRDPPSDDRPKPPMTVGSFGGEVLSYEL
jgi:hypothetical protein